MLFRSLTLGFDATDGLPSGSDVTGGARIWGDDDALDAALAAELTAHTGRPTETLPATDLPSALDAQATDAGHPYARVELAYLDHNYDHAIIERRPDLYALAVAKAVVTTLEAQSGGCGPVVAVDGPEFTPELDAAESGPQLMMAASATGGEWADDNSWRQVNVQGITIGGRYAVVGQPAQGEAGRVEVEVRWSYSQDPGTDAAFWSAVRTAMPWGVVAEIGRASCRERV